MSQKIWPGSMVIACGIVWGFTAFFYLDLALFPGAEILGVIYDLGIVSFILSRFGKLRQGLIFVLIIGVVITSYVSATFTLLLLCQLSSVSHRNPALCANEGIDIGYIVLGFILTTIVAVGSLFISLPYFKAKSG